MPSDLALLPIFLAVGYLAGAIPFGVLIAAAKRVDLRHSGSGNVGATNVGRVMGTRWGLLCFALDVLKGLAPVLAAGAFLRSRTDASPLPPAQQALWIAVALGCILGHVFSCWLGFRGGKGVATSLGVVMGIYPYFTYAGLAAFALWLLVTYTTRYVSLASILAAAAFCPLFAAISHFLLHVNPLALWPLGLFALAIVLLILLRHLSNIRRLLAGTENKIRSRSRAQSS